MDPAIMKVVQLWTMVKQSGKYPMDQVAPGVYFAATDEPPPPGVHGILDPVTLCDFIERERTGQPLSDADRTTLISLLESSGATTSYRAMRFTALLPSIVLAAAIGALIIATFSWLVLGVALFQRVWNGFARWLAARGHPAAVLHIAIALFATLSSIVLTALHAFSVYRLP